jgi:cytochrome c oxidase assembly factor CtaG
MSVYRDRFRAEQAAHFRRVLLMCLGLIAGVIAVGSGLAVSSRSSPRRPNHDVEPV